MSAVCSTSTRAAVVCALCCQGSCRPPCIILLFKHHYILLKHQLHYIRDLTYIDSLHCCVHSTSTRASMARGRCCQGGCRQPPLYNINYITFRYQLLIKLLLAAPRPEPPWRVAAAARAAAGKEGHASPARPQKGFPEVSLLRACFVHV